MSRVLLVNMPFSSLRWPNIGPSLLKAALVGRGIACDVAYLSFDFAERVGLEHYNWIADHFAFVLGGERLFASHYFHGRLPDDDRYFRDVLLPADDGLTEQDRTDFFATSRHVEPFLDRAAAAIDWSRYAVVGFAASFQQTMPSMCLARRVKSLNPEAKIALGGAACESEMGIELLRQFPEVDYVFLGEADLTFPAVVEQILAGRPVEVPPGVVARESVYGDLLPACCELPMPPDSSAFLVRDMDALPYPDFDDYFARLKTSPLKDRIDPLLFYETSRGCWWGQKHHCAFCGLNGATLAFRSKSPARVVDELRYLAQRYGVHRGCAADNILDYRYFKTLLPQLAEAKLDFKFVCELKCNLTRQQVEALLAAGLGAAQLGIETFVTPILKRIDKGANALQNLQTLKWFSEPGIEVKWNLLYGFPDEDPADYQALAELVPSLVHLAPPLAVGRVRMDRFSRYFEAPDAFGMVNPRPNRAFHYVYPFGRDVLGRMAYYYEYDYADGRNPLDYAAATLDAVQTWQELGRSVTFTSHDGPGGVLILHDTRPLAAAFQRRLAGLDRQLYLFCDAGRSLRAIVEHAEQSSGEAVDEAKIRQTLDTWVQERIMVFMDDRYLSLALRKPTDDFC
jgi:ribosomal peptide maturation radical SAM protein 1